MDKKKIKTVKREGMILMQSSNKFTPHWKFRESYLVAKDKVKFLKEYREFLLPIHKEQTNRVFISNYKFLIDRLEV